MNRRSFLHRLAGTAAAFAAGNALIQAADSATTPPAARRPNILFCIADDVSYPHMSALGCRWVKTPAFDRVAREGVLFTQAYTPNAKCAPSRACILTGRNSWQLGAAANHWCYFPQNIKSYPEALVDHGYFVGSTGKGWAPGVARTADGQPRLLAGKSWSRRQAPPPTKGISKCDYAGNFGDFLDARPAGQPFCFWYGGLEPHRGYEFGSGLDKGGKKVTDVDRVPGFWPDNETVRTDMLDYAYEIEHFDRHLGRMLDLLEKRGELDNTLVVVTADNGMPFPRCKGQAYEFSNHMPLAIRWKDGIQGAGREVNDYVSFIDLAPTFLELAGVTAAAAGLQPVQGTSLTEIFHAGGSGRVIPRRDHVLIGKERHDVGRPGDAGYPIRGIVKDGWLFLLNLKPERWPTGNPETGYTECDGSPTKTLCVQARLDPALAGIWQRDFAKRTGEELYHIARDPECLADLAGKPEYRPRIEELRRQLLAELREQRDPRIVGGGEQFDAYPFADPTSIHFYKRFKGGETLKAGWISPTDYDPH